MVRVRVKVYDQGQEQGQQLVSRQTSVRVRVRVRVRVCVRVRVRVPVPVRVRVRVRVRVPCACACAFAANTVMCVGAHNFFFQNSGDFFGGEISSVRTYSPRRLPLPSRLSYCSRMRSLGQVSRSCTGHRSALKMSWPPLPRRPQSDTLCPGVWFAVVGL